MVPPGGDEQPAEEPAPGKAVQVDPITPTLKAPGINLLKLKYDKPLSKFDFKFNLRRYSQALYCLASALKLDPEVQPDAQRTGACHVIHHTVYRCSPRHPPQCVPVLATSSASMCIGARHVIHFDVYRCSPRHPLRCVPVLATSSTTRCTGARHVIHHTVYRCSPRHPPRHVIHHATSSTT